MAKPHERVFALVAALLFLATSVGVAVVVVLQAKQERKLEQAAQTQANQLQENKLQGTKLQNFTPVDKIAELKIIDTKVGDGETVKEGANVVAHYTGALAKDGTIFQSSHDPDMTGQPGQPVPFGLNRVIPGWAQGVPGMKVGGTRRLLIPAALAYKDRPPEDSGIPVNADLVFDIELISIQK